MRYPALVRLWRHFPPSLVPSVSVAIPTMVPGNPHMVTAGSPTAPLDMNPGWRYANHNLGRRGAHGQRAYKNQSQQSFKNHTNISSSPYTAIPTAVQNVSARPSRVYGEKGWAEPVNLRSGIWWAILARPKAPCTLEREGALARTQSRTRPRDREYSPVVARGHHCVRCGGTDRRVAGAFAGASIGRGPQLHGRPGAGPRLGRFLPAIQAGGRDQDLRLPSGQCAGGVHQCADAGGALGMDSLRERVAFARPGAGE